MEFTGRYLVPAPIEMTWAALNDPEILKACIPGCQEMTKTDPTHYEAAAVLKIGPVKATFKARIEMADIDAPRHCTLKGEGQGGIAGFARGEADVTLTPEDGGTVLVYAAKAAIGGKLAQIGQRLIDGAAKQIADDFFTRFSAAVSAIPAEPEIVAEPQAEEFSSAPAIVSTTEIKHDGLAPEIWVVGLIGVIVILLLLFGLVL